MSTPARPEMATEQEGADAPPRAIFVLVHGTWATDTAWTMEESALALSLRTRLGTDTRFHRFQWNGRNSHQDRYLAGQELADFLEATIAENPTTNVFVVAHSHGGNVARYALERGALAGEVKGVVTLATPFLEVTPRNFLWFVDIALFAGVFLTNLYVAEHYLLRLILRGLGFARTLTGWQEVGVWAAVAWTGFALAKMMWNVTASLKEFLLRVIGERLGPLQERLFDSLQAAKSNDTPLMALSFRGDEPGLGLALLHMITEPFSATMKIAGVVLLVATMLVCVVASLDILLELASTLNLTAPGGLGMGGSSEASTVWTLTLRVYRAALIAYLATLLLVFTIPKIVRGHAFGFGPEQLVTSFLLKIATVPAPREHSCLTAMRYPFWAAVREVYRTRRTWFPFRFAWIHSLIYASPVALDDIASWVEARANDVSRRRTAGRTQ